VSAKRYIFLTFRFRRSASQVSLTLINFVFVHNSVISFSRKQIILRNEAHIKLDITPPTQQPFLTIYQVFQINTEISYLFLIQFQPWSPFLSNFKSRKNSPIAGRDYYNSNSESTFYHSNEIGTFLSLISDHF
jgi:hypothetical protein